MNYDNMDRAYVLKKWGNILDILGIHNTDHRENVACYAEFHSYNEQPTYTPSGSYGMGSVYPSPGSSSNFKPNLLPISLKILSDYNLTNVQFTDNIDSVRCKRVKINIDSKKIDEALNYYGMDILTRLEEDIIKGIKEILPNDLKIYIFISNIIYNYDNVEVDMYIDSLVESRKRKLKKI